MDAYISRNTEEEEGPGVVPVGSVGVRWGEVGEARGSCMEAWEGAHACAVLIQDVRWCHERNATPHARALPLQQQTP